MRVFDTFMFSGESDMLWFRLAHLAGKVHRHVIAEATRTHRGIPRELWVPQHLSCCLAPVADKITYVPVEFPEGADARDPWANEHYQRDMLWEGLAPDLRPEDRILVSDVDEIPSDEALAADLGRTGMAALRQRIFHSAVDWEYPEPQLTSVIVEAGHVSWPNTLAAIRDHRYAMPAIENAGWHFSWLGTKRERQDKLARRTCHLEMPPAEWDAIETGATYDAGRHHSPDSQVKAVEVDGTWPEYIRSRRCPPYWFRPR